jgi:hypothetical protein
MGRGSASAVIASNSNCDEYHIALDYGLVRLYPRVFVRPSRVIAIINSRSKIKRRTNKKEIGHEN